MSIPSAQEFEKRMFRNNRLVLPSRIREGIERCIISTPTEIQKAKEKLVKAYAADYWKPPDVRYESDAIIDAYTINYLPRNFFVPRIAIRDLAYNRAAVQFKKKIRILDLGSGTGAVTLGIFELFSKEPLNKYFLDILALDFSVTALKRQERILEKSRLLFEEDDFTYMQVELSDMKAVEKILSQFEPWDLIFSANFMNELKNTKDHKNLVKMLFNNLSENGSIIIAEPSVDRGKKILLDISLFALNEGMTIYYPYCDKSGCSKKKCWIWRDYPIEYINPLKINNKYIDFSDRPLSISTIILNKNGAQILDSFKERNPSLNWGLIAPRTGGSRYYEICSEEHEAGQEQFEVSRNENYNRGTIVGWEKSDGGIKIRRSTRL